MSYVYGLFGTELHDFNQHAPMHLPAGFVQIDG